jgi:hypothetical protein
VYQLYLERTAVPFPDPGRTAAFRRNEQLEYESHFDGMLIVQRAVFVLAMDTS